MVKQPDWIFERGALAQQLAELGFLPELSEHLADLAEKVGAAPTERADFLDAAGAWLLRDPSAASAGNPQWHPLIAAAGFPQMIVQHQTWNIPMDITAATARDLQRRMLELRQKSGRWEFDCMRWFANHIHRGLLEIGRLQYVPAPYGAPFSIYTHKDRPDAVFAFPEAGLRCTEEGWIENSAEAFETVFQDDGVKVTGHPVDVLTGRVCRTAVSLPSAELELRVSRETPVWHVHIPSGAGLDPSACRDSLSQAKALFARCFLRMEWEAFCCTSWLLDRELWKCLPAESNITSFGKMFSALPTPNGTDAQMFERVFAGNRDWSSFSPQSSLQRAIQRRLEEGGVFRKTSGFILRERAVESGLSGSVSVHRP